MTALTLSIGRLTRWPSIGSGSKKNLRHWLGYKRDCRYWGAAVEEHLIPRLDKIQWLSAEA